MSTTEDTEITEKNEERIGFPFSSFSVSSMLSVVNGFSHGH